MSSRALTIFWSAYIASELISKTKTNLEEKINKYTYHNNSKKVLKQNVICFEE